MSFSLVGPQTYLELPDVDPMIFASIVAELNDEDLEKFCLLGFPPCKNPFSSFWERLYRGKYGKPTPTSYLDKYRTVNKFSHEYSSYLKYTKVLQSNTYATEIWVKHLLTNIDKYDADQIIDIILASKAWNLEYDPLQRIPINMLYLFNGINKQDPQKFKKIFDYLSSYNIYEDGYSASKTRFRTELYMAYYKSLVDKYNIISKEFVQRVGDDPFLYRLFLIPGDIVYGLNNLEPYDNKEKAIADSRKRYDALSFLQQLFYIY